MDKVCNTAHAVAADSLHLLTLKKLENSILCTVQNLSPHTLHARIQVDSFAVNNTEWIACEDLQVPGGALVLIPATASGQQPLWITKGHEPYIQGPDEDYYLGLGKKNVTTADTDMLGHALLTNCNSPPCEPTWAQAS